MNKTSFYLFNDDGIVPGDRLELFRKEFSDRTSFDFILLDKVKIDPISPIYKKYISQTLEYTLFDQGHVMKIAGDIRQVIRLLMEIDSILNKEIKYFISPSQIIGGLNKRKFPRGVTEKRMAKFLDEQFLSQKYTAALAGSG